MDNTYRELPLNSDLKRRKDYWEIAKGLQKVDGLKTSAYLETIIEDTLQGKYDTAQAEQKISEYYCKTGGVNALESSKEADISSARITLLLEQGGFSFSPATLRIIHKELFHDVFPKNWVGAFRTVNLAKDESILNGRSVQYANYTMIADTLKYDFEDESNAQYSLPFSQKQIKALSKFVSNIWQVHPFREGNTRTIATFTILYLQNLDIDINTKPFKIHAKYFSDALVRANFSSIKDGIKADLTYLILFFDNILSNAEHDLEKQDLVCRELFN